MDSISVVIPTHDRAGLLPGAIDSVQARTGPLPAVEIIVVDDGSSDGTAGMLRRRYPGVTCLSRAHAGVSAARNAGIRAAAGDWVAFLDSDDAWLPRKLAVQWALLRAAPDHRVVHCDETWLRDGAHLNQKQKHRKRGGHIFRHCLPLCAISPSAVVIHKSVFADVGGFDESLPVCEDYELWLRICSRYPVLYSPEKLVIKHGGHADQLSRRYRGMDRYRIRAIAGILSRGGLSGTDRDAAVRMLHEKAGIYLAGARKHRNSECVGEFEALLETWPLQGAAA